MKEIKLERLIDSNQKPRENVPTLSIREENNLMVERLASICNKVMPAFKSDFYMTPLRLNRDLKYGPSAIPRMNSPLMMRDSSSEMPLPPMDWYREMACSGETSADSMRQEDLTSKPNLAKKDPGFNLLTRFLINQPNSPNYLNQQLKNKCK